MGRHHNNSPSNGAPRRGGMLCWQAEGQVFSREAFGAAAVSTWRLTIGTDRVTPPGGGWASQTLQPAGGCNVDQRLHRWPRGCILVANISMVMTTNAPYKMPRPSIASIPAPASRLLQSIFLDDVRGRAGGAAGVTMLKVATSGSRLDPAAPSTPAPGPTPTPSRIKRCRYPENTLPSTAPIQHLALRSRTQSIRLSKDFNLPAFCSPIFQELFSSFEFPRRAQ